MLKHRLTFGPLMIALLIGSFWLDEQLAGLSVGISDWTFPRGIVLMVVGVVLCAGATLELKRILRACGVLTSRRVLLAASISGLLVPWLVSPGVNPLTAVALTASVATGVLVSALLWHARTRTPRGAAAAGGAALLSFVYLGLMFGFILALRREHSAWVVLGVLVVTKSCDIGAFFTGTLIGKHKLIPWLSPGKTWEGLVGGIIVAAGMGAFAVWLLHLSDAGAAEPLLTWQHGALFGGLFAFIGQAGDLMASMLKRDAGIKDSGAVLPGFGGVLDIIDSLLPVAPLAYWLLHVP
ncbi:MAG: phosphatidate cytidylyltransferase [Pyrinomonadaceae bacterium]|nr:phosphatidate cytidylyltransferase [Phycisphaerales bacterium]